MILFTKTYNSNINIQEIKVSQFPLVIITDTHTNLKNIDSVKNKHPGCQIICLGDITFLFSKPGEKFNGYSINYFTNNNIPCLVGNHDSHILDCSTGNSLSKLDNVDIEDRYDLTQQQIDYLKKLPTGFKLILPNNSNYLCFHNRPHDLWGFNEIIDINTLNAFPWDSNTVGILTGHLHKNIQKKFDSPKISFNVIGRLSVDGDYALLTENGIEYNKI